MKFHFSFFTAIIVFLSTFLSASAQVDSVIGQITLSPTETFAGGISGDGRFVVMESTDDIATENPRNADGNREIFLFDYAQRRIFQITNTKSLLVNPAGSPTANENIKVLMISLRPVISNDGRWIAFGSNATTSTPAMPNATNPGNFDANSFTDSMGNNPLTADGNTEMWLYQIPAVTPVDLSQGNEIPVTDLSAGTFIRATNSLPSRLPVAGTTFNVPIIADDNRDAGINDDGNNISFVSNRDLVPCLTTPTAGCGNSFPNFDNDEIFSYVRTANLTDQVTATPRGTVSAPIYNANPTISGNGQRVAFISNANNPVVGMTGGSNTDNNEEIFYTDLNASTGAPTGTKRQVTQTTPTNPGDVVNILNYGKRMSRDGRYIAFDSYADLTAANNPIQTSFALYVYDTTLMTNAFRQVAPRSDADTAATGGDLAHYPGFTDYDSGNSPQTLVLETRLNITPAGMIPATASDGLNPNPVRPAQVYSYPLTTPPMSATFKRLTLLPSPSVFLTLIQPLTTDELKRMSFNLARTEVGTGNPNLQSEAYYFLLPTVISQTAAGLNFATGASRIPVTASPVPTASPTPSPSPTASPSPSPSPTPETPPAVQGISPGMLAIVDFTTGFNQPLAAQTAVGSLQRRFNLPMELSGVTMTINGAACGLKMVSRREITFVVPSGLTAREEPYPVVINNNGVVIKGSVVIVQARPDVFNFNEVPGPNGRARIFNATNRVLTREPFNVTTLRYRGGVRVPTVLRLYLTGVSGATNLNFKIFVNGQMIPVNNILSNGILREPGIFTVDFSLPASFAMAGDVPIVVTIETSTNTFTSRLEDTAPVFRIL